MTLTKKEKSMILILILMMLIGGFYVYGIAPQNEKLEEYEAKIDDLKAQIQEAEDTATMFSNSRYNNLIKSIENMREELKVMSAPGVDITKEIESGNLDKNIEPHRVAIILRQYMAERGIDTGSKISISEKNVSNGRISYTYTTEYSCQNFTSLKQFVDDVAINRSYYITSINVSENINSVTGVKYIGGNVAITVTYLDI